MSRYPAKLTTVEAFPLSAPISSLSSVSDVIFYVLRTGMPWRDLPERYGPYTTPYNRFNR
jgi:transposase